MKTSVKNPDEKELPPRILNKAVKAAHTSTQRFRLGAVVFTKHKRVLAFAPNEKRTHPLYGSGEYKCLHAETNAIRKAVLRGHDVRGCDIFVYRVNDNCSKPCPTCQKKFKKFGIRYVYYVDQNGNIERMYP